MRIASATLALAALAGAHAARAESFHTCAGFIDTVPMTVTTQGVWCLRRDVATSLASGAAITIGANNVVLDCNGFKIGGLGAGAATQTVGVQAEGRTGIGVRGCNIRGFRYGVRLDDGWAYEVVGNRLESNTEVGIWTSGDGSTIRGNLVLDTGGAAVSSTYAILVYGSADLLDNTVDGVWSAAANGSAVGLRSFENRGGSVAGNRVRGLVPSGSGSAIGVSATGAGILDVSDNVLVGPGDGYGLACSSNTGVRFRGNAIRAFEEIDADCVDAGGNDIAD